MKRQWSMIGAIVLLLLVALLSVLNVDAVPLNFGFAVVEWPLIIIIFVSFLLGAFSATLLSTFKSFKDKRESNKEMGKEPNVENQNEPYKENETASKPLTRSGSQKKDMKKN